MVINTKTKLSANQHKKIMNDMPLSEGDYVIRKVNESLYLVLPEADTKGFVWKAALRNVESI